jgi:superfamily II DNA or RNA helicase
MSLREIQIQRSYDTGVSGVDVLNGFYIPCLAEATAYDRLTGYFSSGALAVAARGISGLIANGGRMRIVSSPCLTEADLRALRDAFADQELVERFLSDALLANMGLEALKDALARDHVRALCWMLSAGRLDIRIAIPVDESSGEVGLYHQKVGVLYDKDGNVVSFSGSINETATGWLKNIEQFKVFTSWVEAQREYLADDVATFSRYWDGTVRQVRVFDLPRAVREHLVRSAPRDIRELELDIQTHPHSGGLKKPQPTIKLRGYQRDAVERWFAAGKRGIFEMATGTGKTLTALAAVRRLTEETAPVVVVVAVPFQHLGPQWVREIERAMPSTQTVLVSGTGIRTKSALLSLRERFALGTQRAAIVVTVHNTVAMPEFVRQIHSFRRIGCTIVLVADEMHALGSPDMRKGLSEDYAYRLGLSATPDRWFDDAGTQILREYFGGVVYPFGLEEALDWKDPSTGLTVLTPYRYFPSFIELTDEELEEYVELTLRAVRAKGPDQSGSGSESGTSLEDLLLIQRARIAKKAVNKLLSFERLLNSLGSDLRHCIIYCIDREQMDLVAEILNRKRIIYRYFTGEEGTTPGVEWNGLSEREAILEEFESAHTHALVAMKCLDEGVDVVQARIGIILASSTNPREYIQRRGRLLRRHKDKKEAQIYDFLLRPAAARIGDQSVRDLERSLFRKELDRMAEFAACAQNAAECYARVLSEVNRQEGA